MQKERWTETELNILKEIYPLKGIRTRENLPNRSLHSIFKKAKRIGLKSVAPIIFTLEHNKKISEKMKGNKNCLGRKISKETKKKIGFANKGKLKGIKRPAFSDLHKQRISEGRKGKHFASRGPLKIEIRNKISDSLKGKFLREKHWNWKGGKDLINRIWSSYKYQEWRQNGFIRDRFTCQKCGDNRGGNLNFHHKKSFNTLLKESQKFLPLLDKYDAAILYSPLWNIDNGITFCEKCHKEEHKKLRNLK